MAEPEAEGEPTVETVADLLSTVESAAAELIPSAEAEGGGSPTPFEIILPPVTVTLFGAFCFLLLCCASRHKVFCRKRLRQSKTSAISDSRLFVVREDSYSNEEDITIEDFKHFQNSLKQLFIIMIAPASSMLFCPLTLFVHSFLTDYFWSHLEKYPNVNDAIGCFLVPAGMVYAITFAYAVEQVMGQQTALADQLQKEVKAARQIMLMTAEMGCLDVKHKYLIYSVLQSNCLNRMKHVKNNTIDRTVNVWTIIKHLKGTPTPTTSYTDRILCKEIVKKVGELSSLIPDAGVLHEKMNKFQWVLLESLGFFTFLGVLLIQAKSYRLEIGMCIVTVVSISLLTAVVSDMDSPCHGFYRIDFGFMVDFIEELKDHLKPAPPVNFKDKIQLI